MEIKGNANLRRPKPIETPTKFRNKNKYCTTRIMGTPPPSVKNSRKPFMS